MVAARLTRALVIGCAANIWDEVKAAQSLCEFDETYCVKLAGVHWRGGPFKWCLLHPEWLDAYKAERASLGLHANYQTIAPLSGEVGQHGKHPVDCRMTYRWPGMNSSASSGIYAAKCALDDGFDRVVLAGIPMEADAGHFTRGKAWAERDSFMNGWEQSVPHLMGRVTSMSGHTKEVLGFPSIEWLAGSGDPIRQKGVMPDQTARG